MKHQFLLLRLTLLLLVGFTACNKSAPVESATASGQPAATEISGYWAGKLAIGKVELRLVLKIAKAPEGGYTATMDSPDQGAKDIPVTSVLFSRPAIQLELDGIGAVYKGDLNKALTEITGNWKQGPQAMPLVFKRTQAPAATTAASVESFTFVKGSKPDIRGYWQGTLDVQGVKLRLALKIARAKDGTYTGSMDSLDQGARDISATGIKFKSPKASLEWKLLNASFEGTLTDDATRMSGNWTQAGRAVPLAFERTEEPVTATTAMDQLSFELPVGSASDIRGYWKGQLEIDPLTLRLVLKIGRATDGSFAGTMDSLDQGSKDLPMTSIEFDKPSVNLEWQGIGGSFQGDLNESGTQMAGTFTQLGRKLPVTFERTAQPATK